MPTTRNLSLLTGADANSSSTTGSAASAPLHILSDGSTQSQYYAGNINGYRNTTWQVILPLSASVLSLRFNYYRLKGAGTYIKENSGANATCRLLKSDDTQIDSRTVRAGTNGHHIDTVTGPADGWKLVNKVEFTVISPTCDFYAPFGGVSTNTNRAVDHRTYWIEINGVPYVDSGIRVWDGQNIIRLAAIVGDESKVRMRGPHGTFLNLAIGHPDEPEASRVRIFDGDSVRAFMEYED